MDTLQAPLLTALIALTGMLLALSLLVQVLQEVYKYLRNGKALAYRIALVDFLGPWASALMRTSMLPDVRTRGPLQFRRLRPAGLVLPLTKDALVDALERTAPRWVQHTLEQLSLEADRQAGTAAAPSQNWTNFLGELVGTEQGSPGYWSAQSVARFLAEANGAGGTAAAK